MKPQVYTFFELLPDPQGVESFQTIFERPGVRFERIVSHGHCSETDVWYEQDWDEWVLVLKGAARLALSVSNEPGSEPEEQALTAGNAILIPAGLRHRVVSTDLSQPTIWLAVHMH